jgi:hypothetical protein
MYRPAWRSAATAGPWYSVVHVTMALVARVRHHICSVLAAPLLLAPR